MQTEEGRIEEEMYEDPTQVQAAEEEEPQEVYDNPVASQDPREEEQEMYEEPSISPSTKIPPVQVTLSPAPSQAPPPVPSPSSHESEAGYMDPKAMRNTGNRDSVIPDNINIEDWASAYDTSFKKGERVRPVDLINVLKRGWLDKLGGRNQKTWQKRFCAISSVFMYFYEKEYSRTYKNRIVVPGYVVSHAPDLTNPKRKQYAFRLTATDGSGLGKDYYFRTDSEEDREEWIGAMKATYQVGLVGRGGGGGGAANRMSVTLPRMSSQGLAALAVAPRSQRASSVSEQENYEALDPIMDNEDQEEYMDVSEFYVLTDSFSPFSHGERNFLHLKWGGGCMRTTCMRTSFLEGIFHLPKPVCNTWSSKVSMEKCCCCR